MGSTRPQPTDEEWLRHKALIRRLYVVDEVPLKQLVAEVESKGLSVTKSQLEYKLKQWEFRRKLDRNHWVGIDKKITKRKKEGKDSQVIFCGKRLKLSTVEKETKRNRDYRVFIPLDATVSGPEPKSKIESYIAVCTPEPLPMEFLWPETLPWLRFQSTHLPQLLSKTHQACNVETGSFELLRAAHSRSIIPTLIGSASELGSVNSQPRISRLAAILGKSIPESYPGENLQRAQTLLGGSIQETFQECLSIVLYNLSNNLSDLQNTDNWNLNMQILRHCGVLDLQIDLGGLKDTTICGFMENLFRIVICRLTDHRNALIDNGEALDVLKWLLSAGQCPNTTMKIPGIFRDKITPLHAAIRSGNIEIMRHLLNAGADANFTLLHGEPETALDLSLKMHSLGDHTVSRMAHLLLEHGISENLERALHLAIWRRDMELAVAIIKQGADICGVIKTQNGLLYEDTAFSAAAAVGTREMEFVLDLLKSYCPSRSPASVVTADVLIAAAAEKKDDTIKFLFEISSGGDFANRFGITPLHAAARKGHLSTCQLLIQLYGTKMLTKQYVFPLLHVASCGGYEGIVRLFIDAGANVHDVALIDDTPEQKNALQRCRLDSIATLAPCRLTPLEMLRLHAPHGLSSGHLACATTLTRAGATLLGDEVILASEYLHPDLLSAVLNGGGNPDETIENGITALQLTLVHMYKQSPRKLERGVNIVKILLEKGAGLVRGEVVSAILLGKWDLVDLLLSRGGTLRDTKYCGLTALGAVISSGDRHGVSRVIGEHPKTYDAGSLCAAIEHGMDSLVDQLLANRPPLSDPNVLEATAIGLASRSENMNLLLKLLSQLPHMNKAVVPIAEDGMGGWLPIKYNHWWYRNGGICGSPLALTAMARANRAFSELVSRGYQADRLTWTIVASNNDLSMAQMLVENSQRLDDNDMQPELPIHNALIWAIKFRNKELVELLLKAGADVNEHNRYLISSRSPLQLAVELGDLDIMTCLLEAGAEVNAPAAFKRGGTALQLAATSGDLGLAKCLIDLGAQVNAPAAPIFGRTALEGAAEHGRLDMLKLFLCYGALTVEAGRRQYVRAVKLALREGHHAAAELLRETRDWLEEDEALFNDESLLDEQSALDYMDWMGGEKCGFCGERAAGGVESMGHLKLHLWM